MHFFKQIMVTSIEDLPKEVLVQIFSFLNFNDIADNCLWTCIRWYDVIADFFLKRYINKIAKTNEDMKISLLENGWLFDPRECIDGELIVSLFEKYRSFKGNYLIIGICSLILNL